MRRALLIVNPYASRVTDELVAAVERELSPAQTVRTERRGHGTELARDADTEAIVVLSGDGGFNEVLNAERDDVPLGFLPGGGTSVLPRALGLPRDPVAAARRIADGRVRRIAVGRVNGRRFGFAAGIGLDAELVRRIEVRGRRGDGRRAGDLAFVAEALRLLVQRHGRFEPALEIAGLGRAAFAVVSNCDPYTYAGPLPLHVCRDAAFELGLDLAAPRRLRLRSYPAVLAYLATGRGLDLIRAHDADRIEIRADVPMPLQADGEDLGDVAEAVFEAERDAVQVLV